MGTGRSGWQPASKSRQVRVPPGYGIANWLLLVELQQRLAMTAGYDR